MCVSVKHEAGTNFYYSVLRFIDGDEFVLVMQDKFPMRTDGMLLYSMYRPHKPNHTSSLRFLQID